MNPLTSAHILHPVPLQQVCRKITLKKLVLEQYCNLFTAAAANSTTTTNTAATNTAATITAAGTTELLVVYSTSCPSITGL